MTGLQMTIDVDVDDLDELAEQVMLGAETPSEGEASWIARAYLERGSTIEGLREAASEREDRHIRELAEERAKPRLPSDLRDRIRRALQAAAAEGGSTIDLTTEAIARAIELP